MGQPYMPMMNRPKKNNFNATIDVTRHLIMIHEKSNETVKFGNQS